MAKLGAVGGGGVVQRRVVTVGGQQLQERRGGEHMTQLSGSKVVDLPGGAEMPGRSIEGLASDALESPWAVPYPSYDGSSASFDPSANGNTYVHGNRSFSNMMMDETIPEDFNNDARTFPEQQLQPLQVGAAAPPARPNHKRAKNFSDHEDEVLVSAWLTISLDPIAGKDQKVGKYWSRIHKYFHEHKMCSSTRTINSLMHRWETIQRCVNKFCSCVTHIERRQQSGTRDTDKVAEACASYKSQDPYGKPFQFMHCWNKLRTQPKWLSKLDELNGGKTPNKKQRLAQLQNQVPNKVNPKPQRITN